MPVQRLSAINNRDPLIKATAEYLQQRFGNFQQIKESQELVFQFQGDRQFVRVKPWHDQFGLNWLMIVVLPETDFMGQIIAMNSLKTPRIIKK